MSKKQPRRSVTVRADLYDQFKAYCAERGKPMSAMLEHLIVVGLRNPPRFVPPLPQSSTEE